MTMSKRGVPVVRRLAALATAVVLTVGVGSAVHDAASADWGGRLYTNQKLTAGHSLVSHNAEFRLTMRADGNLVVTGLGQTFWQTRTAGHPGAVLTVQGDGDLVVRDTGGSVLWHSGLTFAGGSFLTVMGNGELTQFDHRPSVVWYTPEPQHGLLPPRQALRDGQSLEVWRHLAVGLHMQANGWLYLTIGAEPKWAVGVQNAQGAYAAMQGDGNFVIYSGSGRALWSTRTAGHPGARLRLQASDANLVVYSATGVALWSIQTGLIRH